MASCAGERNLPEGSLFPVGAGIDTEFVPWNVLAELLGFFDKVDGPNEQGNIARA